MKKACLILAGLVIAAIFLGGIASAALKYSIIYEASGIRNDGGKCYFVFIKPPNLQNDSFKNDIRQAIREIAGQKGGKITIYFFDDQVLLDEYYNCVLKQVPKSLSKLEASHHLATFSGQYQIGSFINYIYFFPGLTLGNFEPVVGEYVEWQVFDPFRD